MIPKIASALARVLAPIKPIDRPGQSIAFSKSPESGEGGHGPLGYSGPETSSPDGSPGNEKRESEGHSNGAEQENHEGTEQKASSLPLQPGLTQVILDLGAKRQEMVAGSSGVASYEAGVKDQKKASRLPKGTMLDKKVG